MINYCTALFVSLLLVVADGKEELEQSSYSTQASIDGVIVLDASNGFFDKGKFRARGSEQAGEADAAFIKEAFSELVYVSSDAGGSARWHVHFSKPGVVTIESDFVVSDKEPWNVQVGDESKPLQPELTFKIVEPGHHLISLTRGSAGATGFQFNKMKLSGAAIVGARLIRARWRPSAVHAKFSASTLPETRLWVFESQSVGQGSSYSPMTTAFGYFGAVFSSDGKAAGGVNFSMWAASQKAKEAPPLADSPRLIATGNRLAEFGGFGHEGLGVKIRGWEPFAHHPRSVIQALRLEIGEKFNTYYGYFFDEPSKSWVLYAAGQKPVNPRKIVASLRATSFCEVPGPASIERTGDIQRTIRRRGWFLDAEGAWHPVDQIRLSGSALKQPTSHQIGAQAGGWLTMSTGGVELRPAGAVAATETSPDLPVYLRPELAAQLHGLRNGVAACEAIELSASSATVRCQVDVAAAEMEVTLYYGTIDAFTSIARPLHGTEKKGGSARMLAGDRVWQQSATPNASSSTQFRFELEGLEADTIYFCRALLKDKSGQYWAPESSSFTTKLE